MADKTMREHMNDRFGKVFNYALNPPMPASLNIELNNTCNQKCVFCSFHGQYAVKEPKPAVLDPGFAKKVLDQAVGLGIGSKELGFYLAGEPFLYKELVPMIGYAKHLGFKYIFLTTNGALVSEERLKAAIDAGLDSIRFSVNGGDRETYKMIHQADDFEKVKSNIRFLSEYREKNRLSFAISLSCVLTKQTLYTRKEINDTFADYVDDILFIPVMLSRLKNIKALKDKYEIMDDTGEMNPDFVCPMLFDTMYINSQGKVVPCCNAYDDKVEFADLKENLDLQAAWNSDGYERYRKIFLEGISDKGTICASCILRKKGYGRLSFEE